MSGEVRPITRRHCLDQSRCLSQIMVSLFPFTTGVPSSPLAAHTGTATEPHRLQQRGHMSGPGKALYRVVGASLVYPVPVTHSLSAITRPSLLTLNPPTDRGDPSTKYVRNPSCRTAPQSVSSALNSSPYRTHTSLGILLSRC
jgi:hypothetical protein